MNISPKVEPWLRSLLDGVQNSNHNAEVVATAAYAAPALVKALELALKFVDQGTRIDSEQAHYLRKDFLTALALARGETP